MLDKLDPHSSYSNPEETKKMNEPLEGNFEGIGVQFNILTDTLVVVQTIKKGPRRKWVFSMVTASFLSMVVRLQG